nr:tyrosine-type recombinase/integrase [Pseudoalteromonas sp. CNC9-20]
MGHLDPEGVNPFEGHKYSKKKKASRKEQRQAWEVEDVIKLVAKAKSKSGDANLHDLILLGAYTGARIEEIAQLKVEDVKTKDGITFLSIDESKSNAGLRDIPVHNDILPLVNSLVESSPDGYLLPKEKITSNGERSSAIGKRFGRLKRSLGYDERYVFHSLRKTLSTLLERLGLHHNQAAEITGHEKVGETYGTYSVGLTIVEKAELLNQITYQGLNVEPKEGKRRP